MSRWPSRLKSAGRAKNGLGLTAIGDPGAEHVRCDHIDPAIAGQQGKGDSRARQIARSSVYRNTALAAIIPPMAPPSQKFCPRVLRSRTTDGLFDSAKINISSGTTSTPARICDP